MCLVCIAFASWVLKSYNSQSTDMWKAGVLKYHEQYYMAILILYINKLVQGYFSA